MANFFSSQQKDFIISILNIIIPKSDGFPSAGEIEVYNHIDNILSDSPYLKRIFIEGLNSIQYESNILFKKDFISLNDSEKNIVLKNIEQIKTDFFNALILHTYNGYYTNNIVLNLLGPHARPPQPLGYDIEEGDLSSLEVVKSRGIIYRIL